MREDDARILVHVIFVIGDYHVLTAQYIRGAHKYGITQLIHRFKRFLAAHHRAALRALDGKRLEQRVEALTVLADVNGVRACAEYFHSARVKLFCELHRGAAAERDDNAERLFQLQHAHNVINGQRLEVQPVGYVKIGRNRFGIVVYDDCFIAQLFQRVDTAHTGVIKLYSLPYADRARADYHHALACAARDKFARFVGITSVAAGNGVKIGRLRFKFARAGVNHTVDRRARAIIARNDIAKFLNEEPVDFRQPEQFIVGITASYRLSQHVNALVCRAAQQLAQRAVGQIGIFGRFQRPVTCLRAAYRL